jgi:hypothetical protein
MTKRQFIWLVIRFIGFAYLLAAVPAVLVLGNCIWNLIQYYPYTQASAYFVSYLLLHQAAASAAVIAITGYMLFFGKFIYQVVDKSTSFVAECGLDARNYTEIMIRFIGVYFLWGILARLCISLYSAMMLTRLKSAAAELQQIVSKNEMLSQHFKHLEMNLSSNSLIGLILLAGLAFYFLKRGRLVIDLFYRRWLPEEAEASSIKIISNSDASPSDSI